MSFYNSRPSLAKRMGKLMRDREMTVADMARVLHTPYATVYQWVYGTVPREAVYDRVARRLAQLEANNNAGRRKPPKGRSSRKR